MFGVRVFCLMFVSHEDGGVQRSVWGSDDFDSLRSSSREFRDYLAESFEILILSTRTR